MIKDLRKELRARFIDEVACVVGQETILSLLDYIDTLEEVLGRIEKLIYCDMKCPPGPHYPDCAISVGRDIAREALDKRK